MRMRIAFGRRTVRGPARVADAGDALQRLVVKQLGELGELAGTAPPVDVPVIQGGDACRIVTAIFQPLQGVENKRRNLTCSCDADNSAHYVFLSFRALFLERISLARPGLL